MDAGGTLGARAREVTSSCHCWRNRESSASVSSDMMQLRRKLGSGMGGSQTVYQRGQDHSYLQVEHAPAGEWWMSRE